MPTIRMLQRGPLSRKLSILAFAFMLFLGVSACANSSSSNLSAGRDSEAGSGLERNTPELTEADQPPVPPLGDPALRGPANASGTFSFDTGAPWRLAFNASVNVQQGICVLSPGAARPSWAIYKLTGIQDQDMLQILHIDLAEGIGLPPGSFWLGVSQYPQQRWVWQQFEPALSRNSVNLQGFGNIRNAAGDCYVAVLADRDAVALGALTLDVGLSVPAPLNFTCSQGDYTDSILLSWSSPLEDFGFSPDHIIVEYLDEDEQLFKYLTAVEAGNTYSIPLGADKPWKPAHQMEQRSYRLRLVRAGEVSLPTATVSGYAGLPAPEVSFSSRFYIDRIRIQWTQVSDAENYELQFKAADPLDSPADWASLAVLEAPQTLFEQFWNASQGLECKVGVEYQYRVRSLRGGLPGPWSDIGSSIRLIPPITGGNMSATAGTKAAVVDLHFPDRLGEYFIEITRDGKSSSDLIATLDNEQDYTDTDIVDWMPHTYWPRYRIGNDLGPEGYGVEGFRSRWQSVLLSEKEFILGSHVFGSKLLLLGEADGGSLTCLSAPVATLSVPADWQSHTCFTPEPGFKILQSELLEYSGRPMLIVHCFQTQAQGQKSLHRIYCVQSTAADPLAESDWNTHLALEKYEYEGGLKTSACIVAGVPMFIDSDGYDDDITLSRAVNLPPQSEADWSTSVAESQPVAEYYKACLFDLGGLPATSFTNADDWYGEDSYLSFSHSSSPTPAGPADWQRHTIPGLSYNGLLNQQPLPLVTPESLLLALYDNTAYGNTTPRGPLTAFVSNNLDPQSGTDWNKMTVCEREIISESPIVGAVLNGLPVLVYSTAVLNGQSAGQGCPVWVAAASDTPLDSTDWQAEALPGSCFPAGEPLEADTKYVLVGNQTGSAPLHSQWPRIYFREQ